MSALPTDSEARKGYPLMGGCLNYFPAALAGVARWSRLGNEKHNPGEPLHHARGKSMDHGDCIVRHLMDLQALLVPAVRDGAVPTPAGVQAIMDEVDALAWRALALSQELHERFAGAPLAPGAKLPIAEMVIAFVNEVGYHAGLPMNKPTTAAEVINEASKLGGGLIDVTLAADAIEEKRLHAMRGRLEGEKFGNGGF